MQRIDNPAAHWSPWRGMDDERRCADTHLLWSADYQPTRFSRLDVRHLRHSERHDGQLMDHNRHNWRSAYGHWQSARIFRRLDCRGYYLGRIFWR